MKQNLSAPLSTRGQTRLSLERAQALFRETVETLDLRVESLRAEFRSSQPFEHFILDEFLPLPLAHALADEFPHSSSPIWIELKAFDQFNKRVLGNGRFLTGLTRMFIHELNSGLFVDLLERITGIADLVADPKLLGGGLHQIDRGGYLNLHVDYSHHPTTRLNRRLNLLYYLNRDWQPEYGGGLELWDRRRQLKCREILPLFNRCVVFATSAYSYHGHPAPMQGPEGLKRNSIVTYYYSNGRPEDQGEAIEHNTLFYQRPNDRFGVRNFLMRTASSGWVRDVLPPLFYQWLRKSWNAHTLKMKSND